jgi:F-type H+-transporting ATPase subunit a
MAALVFAGGTLLAADAPATKHGETAAPRHDAHAAKHADPEEAIDPFGHVMDDEGMHLPFGVTVQLKLLEPGGFRLLTKFMLLELAAAGLILFIYIPLARRMRSGEPPRGAWDNAFEVLLTFIRDEVARPNIGEHDADRHVPFLWTLFLFILFNNLLGMIPFAGSPTASIFVTGGLALVAFLAIHGAAIAKMGPGHYLLSYWPHMEIPFGMGLILKPMIFAIEILGNFIKAFVLAVRLFANMFAGHTVLSMILLFIVMARNAGVGLWATITVGSVLGVVALSLLELFVAFLQAYIFTFLTALFMGMALHPEH